MTPSDATDPRVAAVIASFDATSLQDRSLEAIIFHRWTPGGLTDRLCQAVPDRFEAASLAKAATMNALRRAPFQAATLGLQTWLDYFNYGKMRDRLLVEEGANRLLSQEQIAGLRQHFTLAATPDWCSRRTVVQWMHLYLKEVYYILLASPFFAVVVAMGRWRKNSAAILLFLMSIATLLIPTCVFNGQDLRYLHPFGFLTPPLLAATWDMISARRRRGGKSHSALPIEPCEPVNRLHDDQDEIKRAA